MEPLTAGAVAEGGEELELDAAASAASPIDAVHDHAEGGRAAQQHAANRRGADVVPGGRDLEVVRRELEVSLV